MEANWSPEPELVVWPEDMEEGIEEAMEDGCMEGTILDSFGRQEEC